MGPPNGPSFAQWLSCIWTLLWVHLDVIFCAFGRCFGSIWTLTFGAFRHYFFCIWTLLWVHLDVIFCVFGRCFGSIWTLTFGAFGHWLLGHFAFGFGACVCFCRPTSTYKRENFHGAILPRMIWYIIYHFVFSSWRVQIAKHTFLEYYVTMLADGTPQWIAAMVDWETSVWEPLDRVIFFGGGQGEHKNIGLSSKRTQERWDYMTNYG